MRDDSGDLMVFRPGETSVSTQFRSRDLQNVLGELEPSLAEVGREAGRGSQAE